VKISTSTLFIVATTGYSGTPLLKKLGINPGIKVALINQPGDYYKLIETDISDQLISKNEIPDLVHLFAINEKEFLKSIEKIKPWAKKNPTIIVWVSWYKKSAKIPTDITEDTIRNYALKNDLVDVKVCAVSEIWSGLKLVVPLTKRNTAKG
jgi:hypothetical protein